MRRDVGLHQRAIAADRDRLQLLALAALKPLRCRSGDRRAFRVWRIRALGDADYIILDPPYFGLVEGCYTERSGNIADFAEAEYRAAISAIARSCASVQKPGGRCTVITAASYTLLRTRTRLHVSLWFMEAFQAAGYEFHDRAFHSRRREAKGGPAIANLNRTAKERRFLTSDIIEILTFRLAGSSSGACRAT
jgi:hypothetical protein